MTSTMVSVCLPLEVLKSVSCFLSGTACTKVSGGNSMFAAVGNMANKVKSAPRSNSWVLDVPSCSEGAC